MTSHDWVISRVTDATILIEWHECDVMAGKKDVLALKPWVQPKGQGVGQCRSPMCLINSHQSLCWCYFGVLDHLAELNIQVCLLA